MTSLVRCPAFLCSMLWQAIMQGTTIVTEFIKSSWWHHCNNDDVIMCSWDHIVSVVSVNVFVVQTYKQQVVHSWHSWAIYGFTFSMTFSQHKQWQVCGLLCTHTHIVPHTHTHTHTHSPTHSPTHTHTHTHSHIHTHTHAPTHTHIHTHTQPRVCTLSLILTHKCAHTHTHNKRTHTWIPTQYVHTHYMHTHIHIHTLYAYTHTNTHTICIHTYTHNVHTHIHTIAYTHHILYTYTHTICMHTLMHAYTHWCMHTHSRHEPASACGWVGMVCVCVYVAYVRLRVCGVCGGCGQQPTPQHFNGIPSPPQPSITNSIVHCFPETLSTIV